MKKIILLVIAAISYTFLHAQTKTKIGLKAGLNISYNDIDFIKLKPGFDAGFLATIPITSRLFLQPEFIYSLQVHRWKWPEFRNEFGEDFHYLYLPVLVKFKATRQLFIEAGPQAGYLYRATYIHPYSDFDMTDEWPRVLFGTSAGAGYQVNDMVSVNARYYHDISNNSPFEEVENRRKLIQVGVALVF